MVKVKAKRISKSTRNLKKSNAAKSVSRSKKSEKTTTVSKPHAIVSDSAAIFAVELEIKERVEKLQKMRAASVLVPVTNYTFAVNGNKAVTLLDLFGDKETLLVIHNMGSSCSYCTLWANGLVPFYNNLQKSVSIVLASKV